MSLFCDTTPVPELTLRIGSPAGPASFVLIKTALAAFEAKSYSVWTVLEAGDVIWFQSTGGIAAWWVSGTILTGTPQIDLVPVAGVVELPA